MLSLEMLDVAIGMIFVYLLISLICTAINEFIEAKLKLRAVDLEQGIRELLNDHQGTGLTKQLYNHQLIYSLFRGDYKTGEMRINPDPQKNRYSRGSDLPSYIPARNFALALMDVLKPATSTTASGSLGGIAPTNDMLLIGNQTTPANANPLVPLRAAVAGIANTKVQQAMLTIIDAAGDDVSKAREGIEKWYNSSMDRVSGWYKRRIQKIMFWMGLALVIFMNADSIVIFNNLVNERPLRSAIVDAAQHVPIIDTTNTSIALIKTDMDSLYQYNLPIGWKWKSDLYNTPDVIPNFKAVPAFYGFNSLAPWLLKILGWIITAFAISLGAPFWFDVLNKVMVVRSTVKPTEKSPDESSQDRQNKS